MKNISKALVAIRDLLKLIPWRREESSVSIVIEGILRDTDELLKALEETEKYPNIDFGIAVAKYLLLRGLHLKLDDHWHIKSWEYEFGTFSKYSEDARGGKGFFEIKILAEINRSWYSPPDPPLAHSVSAHLHIACATSEHFWVPNHSGSYVCIDGKECFEIQCDWGTGNIAIGEEGRGSHVPEWFKKDVVLATSEVSAQQA